MRIASLGTDHGRLAVCPSYAPKTFPATSPRIITTTNPIKSIW